MVTQGLLKVVLSPLSGQEEERGAAMVQQNRESGPPIRQVIFDLVLPSSEVLQLVEYEEGGFNILRAGKRISTQAWSDDELEGCIEQYRYLSHGGEIHADLLPGGRRAAPRRQKQVH
jgi:hypothetical protein